MKIDFVSDVACPWCAVGLNSLERALQRIGAELPVELHFQPFELNPQMAPEGEDAAEHLKAKYGMNDAQLAQNRGVLHERGAAVGFSFGERPRIWNTFDAHRLLHWLGEEGRGGQQLAFKQALFKSYFTAAENPADPAVLLRQVAQLGLDEARARVVLESDEYAGAVRQRQAFYQAQGIHSVPAVIVNGRHLIQGGQPVEAFEQALRQIAAQQV